MKKVIGLLVCLSASSVNAAVIDFTGMSSLLNNTVYSEDGFYIGANSGKFGAFDNSNMPDSANAPALLVNGGAPASITLRKLDGGSFSLDSFWAAEGRNNDTGFFTNFASAGLIVEGLFKVGGSIIEQINFDLVAMNNPSNDFEFFSLSGFTGLSSVTFTGVGGQVTTGYSFQIDTISLDTTSVPEPASIALIGLGLAGIGFARKKNQS